MSYRHQHNEANGENNQDGTKANFSENYGAEGKTPDVQIEAARKGQIKNFLLSLLISRGVPMLLGGDEFRRTQGGNNNAYCQDNETSWVDWTYLDQHREIYRFAQGMIALRCAHPVLSKEQFYTDAEIQWFSPAGGVPDWFDPNEKRFGCLILEDGQAALFLMFNAGVIGTEFVLPPLPQGLGWHLAADTSGVAPHDFYGAGQQAPVADSKRYHLAARTSAILLVPKQGFVSAGRPA